MFIDASAIVAIACPEPDGGAAEAKLVSASRRYTSAIALYEATMALARLDAQAAGRRVSAASVLRAEQAVSVLVEDLAITIVPITAETYRRAIEAAAAYSHNVGHPARLNLGDCFAYACAKTHHAELLYKGDDFAKTDINEPRP